MSCVVVDVIELEIALRVLFAPTVIVVPDKIGRAHV